MDDPSCHLPGKAARCAPTLESGPSTCRGRGTEEFIAEFDRLVGKCIRASEKTPGPPLREAFEQFVGLRRHIDEGHNPLDLASESSDPCSRAAGQAERPMEWADTKGPLDALSSHELLIISPLGRGFLS